MTWGDMGVWEKQGARRSGTQERGVRCVRKEGFLIEHAYDTVTDNI